VRLLRELAPSALRELRARGAVEGVGAKTGGSPGAPERLVGEHIVLLSPTALRSGHMDTDPDSSAFGVEALAAGWAAGGRSSHAPPGAFPDAGPSSPRAVEGVGVEGVGGAAPTSGALGERRAEASWTARLASADYALESAKVVAAMIRLWVRRRRAPLVGVLRRETFSWYLEEQAEAEAGLRESGRESGRASVGPAGGAPPGDAADGGGTGSGSFLSLNTRPRAEATRVLDEAMEPLDRPTVRVAVDAEALATVRASGARGHPYTWGLAVVVADGCDLDAAFAAPATADGGAGANDGGDGDEEGDGWANAYRACQALRSEVLEVADAAVRRRRALVPDDRAPLPASDLGSAPPRVQFAIASPRTLRSYLGVFGMAWRDIGLPDAPGRAVAGRPARARAVIFTRLRPAPVAVPLPAMSELGRGGRDDAPGPTTLKAALDAHVRAFSAADDAVGRARPRPFVLSAPPDVARTKQTKRIKAVDAAAFEAEALDPSKDVLVLLHDGRAPAELEASLEASLEALAGILEAEAGNLQFVRYDVGANAPPTALLPLMTAARWRRASDEVAGTDASPEGRDLAALSRAAQTLAGFAVEGRGTSAPGGRTDRPAQSGLPAVFFKHSVRSLRKAAAAAETVAADAFAEGMSEGLAVEDAGSRANDAAQKEGDGKYGDASHPGGIAVVKRVASGEQTRALTPWRLLSFLVGPGRREDLADYSAEAKAASVGAAKAGAWKRKRKRGGKKRKKRRKSAGRGPMSLEALRRAAAAGGGAHALEL
jgi:hypothetical protein